MDFTQQDRILQIDTPLGQDVLLVQSLEGAEELSKLFSFDLKLISQQASIDPTQIVGKNVTVRIKQLTGGYREYNGFVNKFMYVGRNDLLSLYRCEIIPWLWFLTRTTNCRIFENMTVIDICTQIFDELGFSDYDMLVSDDHQPLEYCVQYRETDFHFISRLLEQDGIFYYFRQEPGKHILYLADQVGAYQDCDENQVECDEQDNFSQVITWEHAYEYRSGKVSQTDYNFQTPTADLLTQENTTLTLDGIAQYDLFDYPGLYQQKSDGQELAKRRIEEDETAYNQVSGRTRCRSFFAGGKFTLTKHPDPAEQGKEYVLTSVHHHVQMAGDYTVQKKKPEDSDLLDYTNDFNCIPSATVFRPPQKTPKAIVRGAQTAVVVGPSGEEIYTDQYGRVKVQFFWDRQKQQSCWLRVSNPWAGSNWGSIFLPRIGQEVIVDFLEGDPDRPIITGRVYNADEMPPYNLPANATQSGFKTRSSKGGSANNFNELRFEDKMGDEQVYIQAEKNMDTLVKNDQTLTVDHDRTKTIKHDETNEIDHDQTETIGNDRNDTVKNDETRTVGQKRTRKVGSDESVTIGSTQTINVSKDQSQTVGSNQTNNVGQNQTEKVGANQSINVGSNRSVSVGGNDSLKVQGNSDGTISGNVTVNTDGSITIQGNAEITINSSSKITLSCGGSSIELSSGQISIQSSTIRLN